MSLPTYFAVPWRAEPLFAPCAFEGPAWRVYEPTEPVHMTDATPLATSLRYVTLVRRTIAAGNARLWLYAADEDYETRIVPALCMWALAEPILMRLAEVAGGWWGSPYRVCAMCGGSGRWLTWSQNLEDCPRCRGMGVVRPEVQP